METNLSELRTRLRLLADEWANHQQKHDTFAMDQKHMWQDILRIDEEINKRPSPPTMIEKLEIQKLQQTMEMQEKNMGMHERHLASLLEWKEKLERKEAANGIAGSGAHAQQLGVQNDDNVQPVRVWGQS